MIRAKVHVPMHFNTFPPIKQDGNDFVRKLEDKGLKARVVTPGATVEI
jgi:L-ascorbate metabolism protein UlaG (beta-lactamase superfamily)